MEELVLRYFGILTLIGAGVFVRKRFRFASDGGGLASFVTSVLFPAYVFGSLVGLDPSTLSFSSGIRIAAAVFIAASAVFLGYRAFSKDPYPFVAASRNYRSLGIPLLYFRFYDSILQEVAVFAVLGMAIFESFASAYSGPSKSGSPAFAKTFFAAFVLGALTYWAGYSGWIDYGYLNVGALLGKGVAGYAYSVLSLFFIGYAVAPALSYSKLASEFRGAWPILLSQVAVWPVAMASVLVIDAYFSGIVTGGVKEIGEALTALSFMPASVTSAAVCAKSGRFEPVKWVAASILLFLLYCPFLLGSSFATPALSVLDVTVPSR